MRRSRIWNPAVSKIRYGYNRLNPHHPLNKGLVALWLFNEGQGSTNRSITRTNTAVWDFPPQWGDDRVKPPGGGYYATISANSALQALESASYWSIVVDMVPKASPNYSAIVNFGNNGLIFVTSKWWTLSGDSVVYGGPNYDVNISQHIICTRNNATYAMYENGVYVAHSGSESGGYGLAGTFRICSGYSTNVQASWLRSLAVYDRPLTYAEVKEVYARPYGTFNNPRFLLPGGTHLEDFPNFATGLADTLEIPTDDIGREFHKHFVVSLSDAAEKALDALGDSDPAGHYDVSPSETLEILLDDPEGVLHTHLTGSLADTVEVLGDSLSAGRVTMDWTIGRYVAPLKIIPRVDDIDPLYLAAHAVRHPEYYFMPRVKTYGTFDRSIAAPAGFIRTGDIRIDIVDPDNEIRQAIAPKTIRKARAELRLGPEGGSYAAFLKPWIREVGTVEQPADGILRVPLRDFTYDWMDWQVPSLINETIFPNLPDTPPAFANIVVGVVSADTGAIPCPLVDTAQFQYLVARHPCKSVDAVYRKRGDEDEFTLVSSSEYTVKATDNSMNGRDGTVIEFTVDQEGAEIRANVQGLYDEITGLLSFTNFSDCIKEVFLYLVGVTESLDRMNFASFDTVRAKTSELTCAGAWVKPVTFGEAFTQLQRSSNIDIFNNKDDRITVAYTAEDDEPEAHLDDLLRLHRGTVRQTMASPTFNRIPYKYSPNFAAGTWVEDAYDNEQDQTKLGEVVEEEPLAMYFVRDATTAAVVAEHRGTWLDLDAFRFEGEIPLVPTVEVLELAQLVSIEHFGGIKSGGYVAEQFKLLELSMDIDNLVYRFKGIRRRLPAPTRIESSVSGYTGSAQTTPPPTIVEANISGYVAENARFGPFSSGTDGELFGVFRDGADLSKLVIWRTTDYGVNWAKADDGNAPNLTNDIGSYDCWVDGSIIHIATQEANTGRVAYHTFLMGSALWGTVNQQVVASAANGGATCVSIETQGIGGNPYIYFQGDLELVSGQYFERGYYSVNSGSWSAPVLATPDPGPRDYGAGPSSNCQIQRVISGRGGNMHFFYTVNPAVTWVQWSPDEYGQSLAGGMLQGEVIHAITSVWYNAPRNVSDPCTYGDKIAFVRKISYGTPACDVYSEGPSLSLVRQVETDGVTIYNSFGATSNPAAFVRYVGGILYAVQATWRRYVTIQQSTDDGETWSDPVQAGEAYAYPIDIQTLGGNIIQVRGVSFLTYFSGPWTSYPGGYGPIFRWLRINSLPF